jgi:hypothetical protein
MITFLQYRTPAALLVLAFVAGYVAYRRMQTGRWLV